MAVQPKSVPGGRLEPIASRHAEAMSRWMSNPELPAAIGLRGEPSPERTMEWIAGAQADSSCEAFAILVADRHVGNVVLDQIDRDLSTARLSIYIGEPEDRGGGLGTVGVKLALAHAFDRLALHKVWLIAHARNQAAINTYERCGFSVEGVLRGEFLIAGERIDAIRMGIMRSEYESV